MAGGDIAQGGAARHIRAVGEILHGHIRAPADFGKHGVGRAIGGVLLIGAELDDHALVHAGTVGGVALLGMVGMHRVGVIRGNHEAGGQRGAQGFAAGIQRAGSAGEYIAQEAGIRALPGAAAHLLIIERAVHIDVPASPGLGKGAQRGEGALQIIQPRRRDIAVLRAPDAGRHAIVEIEIAARDLLRLHARSLGDERFKAVFGRGIAVEGHHIHLGVEFAVLVHLAVHVDGEVGNEQQIPVDLHQTGFQSGLRAHQHAARHGQRTVQPGGHDHAAVALGVEQDILARGVQLGALLDAKGGAIAVAGHNLHRGVAGFGPCKGDDAGLSAGDEVLPAGLHSPFFALLKADEALLFQNGADGVHRMKRAGRSAQKGAKSLNTVLHEVAPFHLLLSL